MWSKYITQESIYKSVIDYFSKAVKKGNQKAKCGNTTKTFTLTNETTTSTQVAWLYDWVCQLPSDELVAMPVYVQGLVSQVDAIATTSGDATFYISADGTNSVIRKRMALYRIDLSAIADLPMLILIKSVFVERVIVRSSLTYVYSEKIEELYRIALKLYDELILHYLTELRLNRLDAARGQRKRKGKDQKHRKKRCWKFVSFHNVTPKYLY